MRFIHIRTFPPYQQQQCWLDHGVFGLSFQCIFFKFHLPFRLLFQNSFNKLEDRKRKKSKTTKPKPSVALKTYNIYDIRRNVLKHHFFGLWRNVTSMLTFWGHQRWALSVMIVTRCLCTRTGQESLKRGDKIFKNIFTCNFIQRSTGSSERRWERMGRLLPGSVSSLPVIDDIWVLVVDAGRF